MLRSLTDADRADWDALTRSLPTGCFMQSWAWADFKALEGYQCLRYGIFQTARSAARLVGGCIFYVYPRDHSTNLILAPGAPILLPEFADRGMQLLIDQAIKIAPAFNAIALRIEPVLETKPNYLAEFVRAPVDLLPAETLLIDLRPAEAEILAQMKPKGRYNIRLSQRHRVTTEFNTDPQAIPRFYDLFWDTVERQQFFGEPYGFFINLCQTLFAAKMAEIGFARWQNQILATVLIVYWGDRATYLYGGRSPQQAQVMATYGLHWAAMQQAKRYGCQTYDLYGFSRDANHAYAKFSRFKQQFGGTVVATIGAHDFIFYDQVADTLISVLKRINQEI